MGLRNVRLGALLLVVAGALAGSAQGQTTNCQPDGLGGMRCQTTPPPPGINWGALRQPDHFGNAMSAYEQGRRNREAAERARLEKELLNAQIARERSLASSDYQQQVREAFAVRDACRREQDNALKAGNLDWLASLIAVCRVADPQ